MNIKEILVAYAGAMSAVLIFVVILALFGLRIC